MTRMHFGLGKVEGIDVRWAVTFAVLGSFSKGIGPPPWFTKRLGAIGVWL